MCLAASGLFDENIPDVECRVGSTMDYSERALSSDLTYVTPMSLSKFSTSQGMISCPTIII